MADGHQFVEAENGERALALLRLVKVDLVIVDIKMPVMDGIEFTRRLRAELPALKALPVVMLTGEKSGEQGQSMRATGLAAGASAFVEKPVSPQTLKEVVDGLLPKGPR